MKVLSSSASTSTSLETKHPGKFFLLLALGTLFRQSLLYSLSWRVDSPYIQQTNETRSRGREGGSVQISFFSLLDQGAFQKFVRINHQADSTNGSCTLTQNREVIRHCLQQTNPCRARFSVGCTYIHDDPQGTCKIYVQQQLHILLPLYKLDR